VGDQYSKNCTILGMQEEIEAISDNLRIQLSVKNRGLATRIRNGRLPLYSEDVTTGTAHNEA